jgi:hypothetical protein
LVTTFSAQDIVRKRVSSLALVFVSLVAASGCGGKSSDLGLAPAEEITCPSAAVSLCTSSAASEPVIAAIDDGAARGFSGIENAQVSASLRSDISELVTLLQSGRVSGSRDVVRRIRLSLQKANAELAIYPGDAPDLAMIELALDQVDELLK